MMDMQGPSRKRYVSEETLRERAWQDYLASKPFEPDKARRLELTLEIVERAQRYWQRLSPRQQQLLRAGVVIPAVLLGIDAGLHLPDLDISLLGIESHRYFLAHSALAGYFVGQVVRRIPMEKGRRLAGAVGGGLAIGMGLHLLADGSFGLLDGQKSVMFGIPGLDDMGSLIEGTLVDDNLYLLGNSLWAFLLGSDMLVLATGTTPEKIKERIRTWFPEPVPALLAPRLRPHGSSPGM